MGYFVEFSNGVTMVFQPIFTKGERRRTIKKEIAYWRALGQECHVVQFCRVYYPS